MAAPPTADLATEMAGATIAGPALTVEDKAEILESIGMGGISGVAPPIDTGCETSHPTPPCTRGWSSRMRARLRSRGAARVACRCSGRVRTKQF
jgi:hypothetical protein